MSTEAIARRQHGIITRQHLIDTGTTRRQIDTMLANGRLICVMPGVYRFAGAPATELQRLWAAFLWAGRDAVVSHRSAAKLWRLEDIEAEQAELWSPRRLRSDAVIVHRGNVENRDMGRFNALRVTSVARTLVDLSSVVDEEPLEGAIEDARRRGLVTMRRLKLDAERLSQRGRSGTAMLRRLLDTLDGNPASESMLEVKVARILRSARLPASERQHEVVLNGRRYRIDFAWPALRFGLECEGFAVHGRRRAFGPDRARLGELVAAGWRILSVTWEQTKEPGQLVSLVKNSLIAAAP
jgi:very-short-patch-repair endonuclease